MKVVSTEGLTKLIQLVKSAFVKVEDVIEVTEIGTEIPSEITLATVATSGSYNDLSNKPDLSGYQTMVNLVTSVSSSSTDSQYPSAKLFYDTIGDVETLLQGLR